MIKDILTSVSKKMQIDFADITSKISHNGEKGTARENMLVSYLKDYIPEKYSFAKGTIVDYKDKESKQVDIIIHDKFTTPYLVDMDSTKIIPIECVYSVVEVKSTLTKEELRKSIKNIESVRMLEKKTITGFNSPTAGLVFAYDSDASLQAVYKNLVELSEEIDVNKRVSCVCVLNKGIILPLNKSGINKVELLPNKDTVYAIFENAEDSLLLFYLVLMQLLNKITISPPDMVAYAESTGMLNFSFSIPIEYVPKDATVNFIDNQVSVAELNSIQNYGTRILSGKLKKEEMLECAFGTYIPLIQKVHGTLDNIPDKSELDYFGVKIKFKELVRLYGIFKNRGEASLQDLDDIKRFENELFEIYDNHREEIIEANKKNKNGK